MALSSLLRKDNPFDYIVLAFIMKQIGYLLGFFVSYHIADSVFGIISWIFIFKGISLIPGKLKYHFTNRYKILLKFFYFLVIVMIIRGYLIDYNFVWFTTIGAINYHLFQPTYILCYLMPLVTLIPVRYYNFRLFAIYGACFSIVTIVMVFIYRNDILLASAMGAMKIKNEDLVEAESLTFSMVFSFVPLLYLYLPKKLWIYNLLGLLACLLLSIIGARRSGTALMSVLLLVTLYQYTLNKKGSVKFFVCLFGVFIVAGAAYFVLSSSISTFLLERGLEDTRSNVEEDMLRQMSDMEMIFGKGLNGRYYCPLSEDDYLNGWRYGIETGFYNLVLKGGYLLAFTYILLLLIPAIKGIFKSTNWFTRIGGFYILFSLLSLIPFGILSFDVQFLYIWMMVSVCMNQQIRRMSDSEIKQQFFNF